MKKGITLIEILISLGLSSVVFLIVSTLIVTILNSNLKSQRQELFEQTKNDILIEMSNKVRWAENVEIIPGDLGELIINDGESTYSVSPGGVLLKNGVPMVTDEIVVTRFTVENFSNSMDMASVQVSLEMENAAFPAAKDSMRFVVSQRKTDLDITY